MNLLLLIVLVVTLAGYTCQGVKTAADTDTSTSALADTTVSVLSFEMDVQPILQSRCTPCHFRGGKMYERMPFDQPETLLDHAEGILKRINDEKEATIIGNFVDQQAVQQ